MPPPARYPGGQGGQVEILALALACAPGVTSTSSSPGTPSGGSGGPTVDTAADTGASTSVPEDGFAFSTVPWSPDVTGVAITASGSICVAGSSWYYGYGQGTAVDQYIAGD